MAHRCLIDPLSSLPKVVDGQPSPFTFMYPSHRSSYWEVSTLYVMAIQLLCSYTVKSLILAWLSIEKISDMLQFELLSLCIGM